MDRRVTFLLALVAFVLSADPNDPDLSQKAVIWGDGLSPHLSIKSVTKSTPKFSLKKRDGWNAKCTGYDACDSNNANGGLQVDSVYELGYEDGVWLPVCLCKGYVMDAKELGDTLAYVPLAIRSSVNKITSKPTGNGAYTLGNSGVYLGRYGPEVFIHESGHSFDFANGLSDMTEWIKAVTADTCVPDPYARTNKVEDWAQTAVLWTYMYRSGADNATLNNSTFSCWSNSRKFASQILPYTQQKQFDPTSKNIISLKKTGKSIGVASDNTTLIVGTSPRRFQLVSNSYNHVLIVDSTTHNGVDAYGQTNPNDRPILFGERNASKNQQWTFVADGQGYFKIINRANGLALDGCNDRLVFQKDNGSDCQKWRVNGRVSPIVY
ncbi:hypothetical protein PROFUN_00950 [Planoprotostelium fungivorum]|uniref:Ricin B lectin domain-containing protein n=1 Tax=Planoprotostelium fungivorum TaxID=1890364 RepID=A0A2P6N493_9EUKA|nr:hypothetical protein PROFUN_00950 [Planoprotostelium fungivorum]